LVEKTSQNTYRVRREGGQDVSEVAIHVNRFKPCVSRYVKPVDKQTGVEELTGPDLPLDMCKPTDFVDTEESKSGQKEAIIPEPEPNPDPDPVNQESGTAEVGPDSGQSDPRENTEEIRSEQNGDSDKDTPIDDRYYPVDRIIRGKYTREGPMYLLKWKGYPSKFNTWEKFEHLSPDTQADLEENPVRMYGRKPMETTQVVKDKSSDNLINECTPTNTNSGQRTDHPESNGSLSLEPSSSSGSSEKDELLEKVVEEENNESDEASDDEEQARILRAYETDTEVDSDGIED
jgi:hypothetical protein